MRKFKVGMAAVLILGIVALFFVVNAFAQSASERLNCPSGALSIFDVQEGINVECVNALFATLTPTTGAPTDTPVPPTDTPIPPTDTPVPPSETPISPSPTSEPSHDDRAWHPLTEELGHEHGDDPHSADNIFGTQFYAWAGGDISYPWQTFRGGGEGFPTPPPPGNFENDFKHEGYKWYVVRDIPSERCKSPPRCISDFRLVAHNIMSADGFTTRFHSYATEAILCDDGVCDGIIRHSGWQDYGYLFVDDSYRVPLPGDPADANPPIGPKRNHYTEGHRGERSSIWYGGNGSRGRPGFIHVAIAALDVWGPVNPDDPNELIMTCPDFQCDRNNSLRHVHLFSVKLPNSMAVDGKINFSGYTDRYGSIVEGCTEVGLDCVPLEIENASPGFYQTLTFVPYVEYDISPPGEFWIEYPN